MIAEEPIHDEKPDISAKTGTTNNYIINAIKNACTPFKKASTQSTLIKPLNENKLTQILVEQIEVKIKANQFIGVKNQYSDLFHGSKGIPDFYFHKVEEGITHEPLFVVEAKRLPSPVFETEYVKGSKNNGGIERFKTEKHGKGLLECGIVGFIEKEDGTYWLNKINSWILDLSKTDTSWSKTDALKQIEQKTNYIYFSSTVQTPKPPKSTLLHHFWII